VQNGPVRPSPPPSAHACNSAVHPVLLHTPLWNMQPGPNRRAVVPSGHFVVSVGQLASSVCPEHVLCVHSKPFAVHPQPLQPVGDGNRSPTWMLGGALTIVRPAAFAAA
jgi:hypothetical protein